MNTSPLHIARFFASGLFSACVAYALDASIEAPLVTKTDIVGYPIFARFNINVYFDRYYLVALVFPLIWIAAYALTPRLEDLGRRRPAFAAEIGAQLWHQTLVGLVAGIAAAVLLGASSWGVLMAWLAIGAVASIGGVERGLARARHLNIGLGVLAPLAVGLVSRASALTVSDGAVLHLDWFPVWLGLVWCALAIAIVIHARRHASSVLQERLNAFVVFPSALLLLYAAVPEPLSFVDHYHLGEQLAALRTVQRGLWPWRDILVIHGPLQDILFPMLGWFALDASAWGADGTFVVYTPAICAFATFLYVRDATERRPLPQAALLLTLLCLPAFHPRAVVFPVALIVLHRALAKRSRGAAFGLAWLCGVANLLTPELAFAAIAIVAMIVLWEWRDARPGGGLKNYPLTIATGAGAATCLIAITAVLAAVGALRGVISYYTTFADGHRLVGGLPVNAGLLADAYYLIGVIAPVMTVLVVAWLVYLGWPRRAQATPADASIMAMALVIATYYQKYMSRADYHVTHVLAMALPCCVLVGLRLAAPLLRRVPVGGSALLAAALVALAAPAGYAQVSKAHDRFVKRAGGSRYVDRLGPLAGRALAQEVDEWASLTRFFAAYESKDAPLFDFADTPLLTHYILDRPLLSPYYHVSLAVRRRSQLDLIAHFERTRPLFVIYDSPRGYGLGDGVPRTVRYYAVSTYLLEHYAPFADVSGWQIWARIDAGITPRDDLRAAGVRFLDPSSEEPHSPCDWGFAPSFFASEASPDCGLVGRRWHLRGWAIDRGAQQPAAEVRLEAGDRTLARAAPKLPRPDVAAATGCSACLTAGFELDATVPDDIAASVRLVAVGADGKAVELEHDAARGFGWSRSDGGPASAGRVDAVVETGGSAQAVVSHAIGWAVDLQGQAPAAEVVALSEGRVRARVRPAEARMDVARETKCAACAMAGFRVSLPSRAGATIAWYGLTAGGSAFALGEARELPKEIEVGGRRYPVRADVGRGWVDAMTVGERGWIVDRTNARDAKTLAICLDMPGDHAFTLSDRIPGEADGPTSSRRVSFRTNAAGPQAITVPLENCPQWRAFERDPVYLWHDAAPGAVHWRLLNESAIFPHR
ncbi:MAG: hypothetical protein IT381_00565 [Deltaproteobacteria bacterium]|nr:hypothetical protein [Deltaproteobacteria bacterium]